jgi:hypothetical protein
MPPIYECLNGATEQYIRGNTYQFASDGKGRFVAEVFDQTAIDCFESHGAYRLVDDNVLPAQTGLATGPTEAGPTRSKTEAIIEAKELGLAVTQRMSLESIETAISDKLAAIAYAAMQQDNGPTQPVEAAVQYEQPVEDLNVQLSADEVPNEPDASTKNSGNTDEPDSSMGIDNPVSAAEDPDHNDED